MANWHHNEYGTVLELMEARLEADPGGRYIDVGGTEFTAAEVRDVATRVAAGLMSLGVQPGDRVATLMENRSEAMLAWWGIVHAGAVAVPINSAYKGSYLRHQLGDSGSRVLIVEADFVDRATEVLPELPELSTLIVVGSDGPDAEALTWDELLTAGGPWLRPTIRPQDLATFVYTGGTTGPSKGCMLSHAYHSALSTQIGVCWAARPTTSSGLRSRCSTSTRSSPPSSARSSTAAERRSTGASRSRTSGPR